MHQPFPRRARKGPPCPHCGGETLLAQQRPDIFECVDCGYSLAAPADDLDFYGDDDEPDEP